MRKSTLLPNLCFILCGIILLTGCNETFQPLEENSTSPFSIFGFLDASVDTQWVRVSPLREQLDSFTEKPEMEITLENLSNGKSTAMADTLIRFFSPSGINAPNAWTTMKLDFGQTYRLEAKRPDGATSSAVVTTPENFPTPRLEVTGFSFDRLVIRGAEPLVDVQSRWFYCIVNGGQRFDRLVIIPYIERVEKRGPGEFVLNINTVQERRRVNEQFKPPANAEVELLGRQIFVAVAGPEWDNSIRSFNDLRYALPDEASNVENGVGYVIGIVSKSIPYKNCFDEAGNHISCPEEQPIF